MLALSGDMPRKMKGTDFIQSTTPDLLFRDVSLYTETISTPSQTAMVIHLAIAAAYAGPGVAHLTLSQDVLEGKADGAPFSVSTLRPRAEIAVSESNVAEVAHRIDRASSPSSCAVQAAMAPLICCAACRIVSRPPRAHPPRQGSDGLR